MYLLYINGESFAPTERFIVAQGKRSVTLGIG